MALTSRDSRGGLAFMVAIVFLAGSAAVIAFMRWSWRQQALVDANWPMRYLLLGVLRYADDNAGAFPAPDGYRGLLKLYSSGMLSEKDEEFLSDPRKRSAIPWQEVDEESDVGYWYIGGHGKDSPPNTPILIQKKGGRWGYVGYADGRILVARNERWEKLRGRIDHREAE